MFRSGFGADRRGEAPQFRECLHEACKRARIALAGLGGVGAGETTLHRRKLALQGALQPRAQGVEIDRRRRAGGARRRLLPLRLLFRLLLRLSLRLLRLLLLLLLLLLLRRWLRPPDGGWPQGPALFAPQPTKRVRAQAQRGGESSDGLARVIALTRAGERSAGGRFGHGGLSAPAVRGSLPGAHFWSMS